MKPLNAIERMLAASGKGRTDLAVALGRPKQSVTNMFRLGSDVKMSTMLGACACTGYKMLLVSDDGDRIEVDLPPTSAEPRPESPKP